VPPFRYQHSNAMGARGLFVLLFLILVVAAVVWVVLMSRQRHHDHHHGSSHVGASTTVASSDALRILDERFARGEIDAEEFTKRRELLRNSS
jgi:putative membrane protein